MLLDSPPLQLPDSSLHPPTLAQVTGRWLDHPWASCTRSGGRPVTSTGALQEHPQLCQCTGSPPLEDPHSGKHCSQNNLGIIFKFYQEIHRTQCLKDLKLNLVFLLQVWIKFKILLTLCSQFSLHQLTLQFPAQPDTWQQRVSQPRAKVSPVLWGWRCGEVVHQEQINQSPLSLSSPRHLQSWSGISSPESETEAGVGVWIQRQRCQVQSSVAAHR